MAMSQNSLVNIKITSWIMLINYIMEIKTQIYYSNFIFHIGFDHASKCQQPKVGWILGNVDTGWWLQAIIIPWQEKSP